MFLNNYDLGPFYKVIFAEIIILFVNTDLICILCITYCIFYYINDDNKINNNTKLINKAPDDFTYTISKQIKEKDLLYIV